MDALEWLENVAVHINGGVDGMEKLAKGLEPLGLQVREIR
jgi:hypothetical protein